MNALLPALLTLAATAPDDAVSVRRFAVVAAANHGGADRVPLRYAVSDADTMARVLRDLGGVAPEDELVLVQPNLQALQGGFRQMARRLAEARGTASRLELILYYSGHSDESGLLIGEERLSYRELKGALSALPADVRIAILDSCASGAMTRQKGGKKRPPFVVDASNQVRGYAVLTSSSEDEAAQESDRIGASYFTHYLVSGLRGAADTSQDGRVTLNEAYHFAFHETLARTENTLGGPQHPAYDIQLVGSGDLVMTDLRSTAAALQMGEPLYGRVSVRDDAGRLVAELRKVAGRPVELGLDPGRYRILLEQDGARYEGEVRLAEGRGTPLEVRSLSRVDAERTVSRGAAPVERENPAERRVVPVDVGILPELSVNGHAEPSLNYLSLSLLLGRSYDLHGVGLALGGSWVDHELRGIQAAIGFAYAGGPSAGLQWSVGGNVARAGFGGVQASTGFNLVDGDLIGAQGSVGLNVVQGDLLGLQGATGANFAQGMVEGAQLAVGVNYAKHLRGLQFSSGVNVAGETVGGQAGLVNVAGVTDGAQLGLVNVAESVSGLQLGLVNVVERTEGLSLGLLSYATEDGIFDVRLYTSDVALGGVALEIGTRNVYTLLSFSGGTWEDPSALAFGFGLGGRIHLSEAWQLEIEAHAQGMGESQDFSETDTLATARVALGWRLAERFAIFFGPALNVLVDVNDVTADRHRLAPAYASRPSDRVYLWPGFVFGLQLL